MAQFIPRSSPQLRQCLQRPAKCARRQFSTHPRLAANAAIKMHKPAQRNRPSMVMAQRDEMKNLKKEDIPEEFGMLAKTFVLPSTPSLSSDPKLRLSQLREFFSQWWKEWFQCLYLKYRFYSDMSKEDRPKTTKWGRGLRLDLWSLRRIAKDLHLRSYNAISTAVETGDMAEIKQTCGDSLAAQYTKRVQQNTSKRQLVRWELVSYKFPTTVLSKKIGQLPLSIEGFPVGFEQAVVRIRSEQRLTVGTLLGKGKGGKKDVEWGTPKTKQLDEYVVISRKLIAGKFEPWKIFGFVRPVATTAARLEEWRLSQLAPTKKSQGSQGGVPAI